MSFFKKFLASRYSRTDSPIVGARCTFRGKAVIVSAVDTGPGMCDIRVIVSDGSPLWVASHELVKDEVK